jgi:voltage-gated potassium channel Kch
MPESQENLAEAAAAPAPSAPNSWLGTLTKRWLAGAAGIALLFGLFALAQPINVAGNPLLLAGLCFFLFTSYWAVALLLLGYAFLYHSLSFYDAEAFTTAIATKISAVYFSVTTLSTVGFGEISPGNDTARLVVMSQMILDLTLLGLGVKLLSQASKNRAQELASQSGDSDQPAPQS